MKFILRYLKKHYGKLATTKGNMFYLCNYMYWAILVTITNFTLKIVKDNLLFFHYASYKQLLFAINCKLTYQNENYLVINKSSHLLNFF